MQSSVGGAPVAAEGTGGSAGGPQRGASVTMGCGGAVAAADSGAAEAEGGAGDADT